MSVIVNRAAATGRADLRMLFRPHRRAQINSQSVTAAGGPTSGATWRFGWLRVCAVEFAGLDDRIVAGSAGLPPYQQVMAQTAVGFNLFVNGHPARESSCRRGS
jgi:hypothetical protein